VFWITKNKHNTQEEMGKGDLLGRKVVSDVKEALLEKDCGF